MLNDPKKPATKQTTPTPVPAKVSVPPVKPLEAKLDEADAANKRALAELDNDKLANDRFAVGMVAPTTPDAPIVPLTPVEVTVPIDTNKVELDSRDFHSPLPENLMTNDHPDVPPTHIDPQPAIVSPKLVSLNFACTFCGARYPHQVAPCPLCGGAVIGA